MEQLLEKFDKYKWGMDQKNQFLLFFYGNLEIIMIDCRNNMSESYKVFNNKEEFENWLDEQLKEESDELSYKDYWLLGLKLKCKFIDTTTSIKTLSNTGVDLAITFSKYEELKRDYTLLDGSEITYKNFLKWKFEENKKYEDDYERLCGGK